MKTVLKERRIMAVAAVTIYTLAIAFLVVGVPMMLIPLALISTYKSLWLMVTGILLASLYVVLAVPVTLLSTLLTVPFVFDFERKDFVEAQFKMTLDGLYGAWTVNGRINGECL